MAEFNSRFHYLPYKVKIRNAVDCVLGEWTPFFDFTHGNNDVKEDKMREVLSEGEKRSLYLLHIIFDLIELQENNSTDKILIIDDIVDSFDYKNKHAILEYIYDVTSKKNIYVIILTHSFDFYRSIMNLFQLKYGYIADRNENKIDLIKYNKDDLNPCKKWLKLDNIRDFISSITLIRNLCDYKDRDEDKDLKKKLINLLHYPIDDNHEDIKNVYVDVKIYLGLQSSSSIDKLDGIINITNLNFYDKVIKQADLLENKAKDKLENIDLQDKVILSIALRLELEKKIIKYCNINNISMKEIKSFQTRELIRLLKKYNHNLSLDCKRLLDIVNMISSNNIHINSFMYEPLLDINGKDLVKYYTKLKLISL